MHSNILLLSQWGMNFSDWLGPYKSYENIVFLFIVPFSPFPTPLSPENKRNEKTIANISYCLKEKKKKKR